VLVKLVDFGIAKTLPLFDQETVGLTQTGEILGSPAYMSPEHCLGEPADERSDIYSLGCVMYEALTGQPPFTARHPIQAILQHLRTAADPLARRVKIEDQPTMPADFDYYHYRQAIEAVVMRCLEKDPAHRYQSADALRLDLEALSKNLAPEAPAHRGHCSDHGLSTGDKLTGGRIEAAVTLVVLALVLMALWIARAF
jgi:serine/threonine-protein kinase